MKMIVKRTGESTEFTFEDANLQDCTALIKLFDRLEEPEDPIFEFIPVPAELLLNSGSDLDLLGQRVNVPRGSFRETDEDYRYRLAKNM